jgi:hypothetical protein
MCNAFKIVRNKRIPTRPELDHMTTCARDLDAMYRLKLIT